MRAYIDVEIMSPKEWIDHFNKKQPTEIMQKKR